MNNLMIFEGHEVEVLEVEGQVLFNPKHVAECLEIADVNSSIRNFNEKQVVKLTNSDVHNLHIRKLNNAGENFLTESGVYKLVFKSHKPNAEAFTDWIADEVLPSIRKHGMYATDNVIDNILNNPDFGIKLLTELKEERTKRAECEQKIKQQEAEIIHKEDVIIGLVDDISLAEKRQILNRVVRYNHANYQKRWQLLYREFESKYHIDLQKRLDNYNADHKPKCKSKLDYIDRVMGKVPELYEIATKLFESDVKALVNEMYLAIIA